MQSKWSKKKKEEKSLDLFEEKCSNVFLIGFPAVIPPVPINHHILPLSGWDSHSWELDHETRLDAIYFSYSHKAPVVVKRDENYKLHVTAYYGCIQLYYSHMRF